MKKILVIGEPASIHANRFILLLQQAGYDVRLFPCEKIYYLEEHLEYIKIYAPLFSVIPIDSSLEYIGSRGKKIHPVFKSLRKLVGFFILRLIGNFQYLEKIRSRQLSIAIDAWKPNLLISLKLQNEGYLVNFAKKISKQRGFRFPAWLHFCWGTDLEFFGKHPKYKEIHLPLIKSAMSNCDYLLSDSMRDVDQAGVFGFQGENLGFMLATGGFHEAAFDLRNRYPPRSRSIILVKGREGGLVGRVLNVVEALKRISTYLAPFEIHFIMVSEEARAAIESLYKDYGLKCKIENRLSYSSLVNLFCKSRISISASDLDGTPAFLLESIAFGAFPIHSKMASINDWIIDGKNGLTFDVNNIDELSKYILFAITNEILLESAFTENQSLAIERINRYKIAKQLNKILNNIL